jgi:hypothetical protein
MREKSRLHQESSMRKTKTVIHKKVEGQVLYNDGEFTEIQTNGIEGMEDSLRLETIQTHREDTNDTPEEFVRRTLFLLKVGEAATTLAATKQRSCGIKTAVPMLVLL